MSSIGFGAYIKGVGPYKEKEEDIGAATIAISGIRGWDLAVGCHAGITAAAPFAFASAFAHCTSVGYFGSRNKVLPLLAKVLTT